jgi:hypothetical protein
MFDFAMDPRSLGQRDFRVCLLGSASASQGMPPPPEYLMAADLLQDPSQQRRAQRSRSQQKPPQYLVRARLGLSCSYRFPPRKLSAFHLPRYSIRSGLSGAKDIARRRFSIPMMAVMPRFYGFSAWAKYASGCVRQVTRRARAAKNAAATQCFSTSRISKRPSGAVAGEPVDDQRRIARGDFWLSDDRRDPDDSARVRLG